MEHVLYVEPSWPVDVNAYRARCTCGARSQRGSRQYADQWADTHDTLHNHPMQHTPPEDAA